MEFKTLNTKDNKEYIYSEDDVKQLFEDDCICHSYTDKYIDDVLLDLSTATDKEELKDLLVYFTNNIERIVFDKKTYLTNIIEDEKWCSPRGVEPVFRVIEVLE